MIMDTRLLYVIALCVAVVSGLFYYYSGKAARQEQSNFQDVSFIASNVNALKTDDTGALSMKTQAQHLQQWANTNRSELNSLNTAWYENGQAYATFKADKAHGYDNNSKIVLMGNIVAQRLPTGDQSLMTFTTTQLTGYPKEHRVETSQPVVIQSAQGRLTSQGLKANLNDGQFNLFHMRGQYIPVRRSN